MRNELGIKSAGTIPAWKSGAIPDGNTLARISLHFGVSVGYLLGHTDVRSPAPPGTGKPSLPEGEEGAARLMLDDAMDGLSEEELRQLLDYAAFLKSRRTPTAP